MTVQQHVESVAGEPFSNLAEIGNSFKGLELFRGANRAELMMEGGNHHRCPICTVQDCCTVTYGQIVTDLPLRATHAGYIVESSRVPRSTQGCHRRVTRCERLNI